MKIPKRLTLVEFFKYQEEIFKYQADRWRECAVLCASCVVHSKESAENLEKVLQTALSHTTINGKGIKV